jgi:hypothetical protein
MARQRRISTSTRATERGGRRASARRHANAQSGRADAVGELGAAPASERGSGLTRHRTRWPYGEASSRRGDGRRARGLLERARTAAAGGECVANEASARPTRGSAQRRLAECGGRRERVGSGGADECAQERHGRARWLSRVRAAAACEP